MAFNPIALKQPKLHRVVAVFSALGLSIFILSHMGLAEARLRYYCIFSSFSFQNNPKDLDPSCKMDLDL